MTVPRYKAIRFQKIFEKIDKVENEEDLSEYSFRKYAATHFIHNANYQYSKKPLKESLHLLPTPDDVLASQALWITILRFMGDMSEPKYDDGTTKSHESIMALLSHTLSRSFQNRKEYQVFKQRFLVGILFKIIVFLGDNQRTKSCLFG